jgi:cellobiose phosphorylase
MMGTTGSVFDILSRLRVYFQRGNAVRNYNNDEPFRSELYSTDQMNRHGIVLAKSHKLMKRNSKDQLLKRLDDNEKALLEVRNLLVEGIRAGKTITPGAEWLLDNFYLIEEQVIIAGKHLPKGYSEGLPYLSNGISAGMPRVYDIVLEIISHSDGRVDVKSLSSFIAAYQTVTILTLGELWAIPIMLRLAVIENLRRVSGKTALDMIDHNLADYWADRMINTVKEEPGDLILNIADMVRSKPVLVSPFVAGFARKLQGKGPGFALALNWMEQQLLATGLSTDDLVRQENQKQAIDQVSVSNSIGTLRFLGATDWRKFVESLSSVEKLLRLDSSGTYPLMDFATRDRYRHAVEALSKTCAKSETEVAQIVLTLTQNHNGGGERYKRYAHVGYYLVDKGLKEAELAACIVHTVKQQIYNFIKRMPLLLYVLAIIFFTGIAASVMVQVAYQYGNHHWLRLLVIGILAVSGSAQLAVSLINWVSTILVKPTLLPRMDFSEGIPAESRTLVVIPTMLASIDYIEELIEGLEIRYLANRDDNLHFGLLTDLPDADTETMADDTTLVELADKKIAALNQKYKRPEEDIFFLFHRPRTWNANDKKWMGYERKRGKLSALNALLRGRDQIGGAFSHITGNYAVLRQVKYVITLDSDTQLPRESVWKFIATMAHPLNEAIYDTQKMRVIDGYGILQPRIEAGIPKKAASMYLRIQGDVSGIDPYTRVSSDVYQDIFGEGSFIGKGIYDVDIFEQALNGVFRENRILSHDLLEGCYARSGLLSDVFLYEENPAAYTADIKRHYRWIRGDWQIGAWMLPLIRNNDGKLVKNKLSALSKWKIFDNLRRSLLPISLLFILLMGWSVLPYPWFWTLSVTFIILFPVLTGACWQLIHKPIDLTLHAHLIEVGISIRDILIRFVFVISVLPYEAFKYTDAIVRTVWRMVVSQKKLLEWTTSATSTNKGENNFFSIYGQMCVAPLLSIACTFLFWYTGQFLVLLVAAPMLVLWLLAPAIAWWLSAPGLEENPKLSEEQVLFLNRSARKIWSFFEEFVTADEHWLPPDNFQEQPIAAIAHRTSPTNMGLALLANLTAYDFGYITGGDMLLRCNYALQTMLSLERYKGHFYNWYDTLTLLPMRPKYVSTVDSGNLAGHLLTLRQGLLAQPEQPVFSIRLFEGMITTTIIIQGLKKEDATGVVKKILDKLNLAVVQVNSLTLFEKDVKELQLLITELAASQAEMKTELQNWIIRLQVQITAIVNELEQLTPWVSLLPASAEFVQLEIVDQVPTLLSIQSMPALLLAHIKRQEKTTTNVEEKEWLLQMQQLLESGSRVATERILLLAELEETCEGLSNMEYGFLLDQSTWLLKIGYNVDEQRKDDSSYDLLASEARLGIFVAIAQGKLPQESWFALGRLLTKSGGDAILLSWSGSMFEYLMPQLVMPAYENTLLYQTNKATVKRQIEYAAQRGVPWGISESGYNTVDSNLNYQYRAFGVPGLGLKRGLEEDLVIAPYASMLALMVSPAKACANLQLLSEDGFEGVYGLVEAIDYTPSRVPRGRNSSIVHSFMVHHQGMSLLSLAYLLLNRPMQQRFIAELRFQATVLLLQERIPRATLFYAHTADQIETNTTVSDVEVRRITNTNTAIPEVQLLSNGRYQVMITNSGGGYSRWKDIAVTRWREDATKDDGGIFCYIKDVNSGKFWSNTYQPSLHVVKDFEAIFSQGHVEFHRQNYGIDAKTEIVISPEDDTEMRRLKLTNKTLAVRILEITSYAEVVLATQAADEAHPAFSNLFVQTTIVPEHNSVFCTRRPRTEGEIPPWMFHYMDVQGATVESVSYETDRLAFIGRGKTLVNPQAMEVDTLSGKQGAVLDPIVSIRYRIALKPNHTATIDMIYGVSETKESCENLMHKYQDTHLQNRAFELSWTHSHVMLRQINATEADAQLYDKLAASLIFANPALRADATVILSNFRGQSGLWSHSVSGDLPIVLLHIYDSESMEMVRQLIQAHAYWRLKGLAVDLVIWNEDHGSYRQALQEQILGLITIEAGGGPQYNKPGNIFVRSADQISYEDRTLFESVARVVIYDNKGTLAEQLDRHYAEKMLAPLLEPKIVAAYQTTQKVVLPEGLLFFNGIGGFTPDGKEYKIMTSQQETTPTPWVNVMANPNFGTVISESGSAYTWAVNSHEYRITPWNNDPVTDIGGEAFYLRDEETGNFWSPSPFPKRGTNPYIVTHGFGYSIFEQIEMGISSEMSVFVDKILPVKYVMLKIKNLSGRERKLSATGFLEIILGDLRSKTNMHVVSEMDTETGALLLRNRYNTAFAERVSFFAVEGQGLSFTADRSAFIGRNGNLQDPQALYRKKLSGLTGAGIDPCAALQVKFELLDGAEKEIIFRIGNAENTNAVKALIKQPTDTDTVLQSLQNVKEYWGAVLGAVQVTTPDTSLNILANGWLVYQAISCRIFARSGFYQSGGAFGFRDQLQDVLALLHTQPLLAREQILLSASRQFAEGDVQHWWHPPEGKGIRTHCSDDMLWLPFAVLRYVAATGDKAILTTRAGFLECRLLHPQEDSFYDLPVSGNLAGTLYEHCVRAIKHSLHFGAHGLPLMGSGDWNDGMDLVGHKGQGESVWLAFFLYDILVNFAEMANSSGDAIFAETCKKESATLRSNIEAKAWDGEWYLRAFFDDGTPLGSKQNTECRIDAIAQSWSVLSGAADGKRAITAMGSLDKYLVNKNLKLIQLLDPAFDTHGPNPGYIKGYVPGVRENGGQYTHAAVWTLMAFAALGNREKTWELFNMVNPINHATDKDAMHIYKVEPYVIAADVYTNESHKGRGGWTWYTGSAGWMYQFITGSLLGMQLLGDQLQFKPCFPLDWPSVSIVYRYKTATYNITIFQTTDGISHWEIDSVKGEGDTIKLTDDGIKHEVLLYIH